MRLNAPKKIVWLISLILAIVSLVFHFKLIVLASVSGGLIAFIAMGIAWLLLFLATFLKGF